MRSSDATAEKVISINDLSKKRKEGQIAVNLVDALETVTESFIELCELYGLKKEEYVNTGLRRSEVRTQVGGGQTLWTPDQQRVIESLQKEASVERLYYYNDGSVDHFIVTTREYDSEIMMHFVNRYWEIYDFNPDYDFEIDSFATSDVSLETLPEGAKRCFSRD